MISGHPKVYLAGPTVFHPEAIGIGRRMKEACRDFGFQGLFPFDNEASPDHPELAIDHQIYAANVEMIRAADAGVFNLSPFRGPSADAGTCFELGMMVALGKPVVAYTHDTRDYAARVRDLASLPPNAMRDLDNLSIEDFGNADNLMVDCSIKARGQTLIRMPVCENSLVDLDGLRASLAELRKQFAMTAETSLIPR